MVVEIILRNRLWKTCNIEARGSRTHLDDGHQTDPGLLCDTLPSLSQSAPIFCRKHTDETGFLLKMDPHSGRLRGSDVTRHLRRYKLKKKKTCLRRTPAALWGLSVLLPIRRATRRDPPLNQQPWQPPWQLTRRSITQTSRRPRWRPMALRLQKTLLPGREEEEEERKRQIIQCCIRCGAKVKEKNTFVQFYSS